MDKLTPTEKVIVERLSHLGANVAALTVFTKSTHKEVKTVEQTHKEVVDLVKHMQRELDQADKVIDRASDLSIRIDKQSGPQLWMLGGIWIIGVANLIATLMLLFR